MLKKVVGVFVRLVLKFIDCFASAKAVLKGSGMI